MQDNASRTYLARVEKSFRRDYDGELPAPLVVPSSGATWLEQDKIPNPARIGPLLSLPAKSFEISLQKIPVHGATDLHRHAHEAVHYVRSGHGYSEIGGTRHDWQSGGFIYTPPWTILCRLPAHPKRRHENANRSPIGITTSMPSRLNSSSSRTQNFSKRLACMKERVSASSTFAGQEPRVRKATSAGIAFDAHEGRLRVDGVPSFIVRKSAAVGGKRTSGYWSHRQSGAQMVNLILRKVGSSYSEEAWMEIL